ncbi:uncharacterized protein DUF3558 [Murinocardiopsis flavida]|uniref:Uncharacterized protein DUF3558 n=1 Tax=Murinocardiopsis flavida TaxID=645275 RepID=A0A2P8DQ41_9ACTN|nr:DUF3558 family protein [Murinocardiopsis flavida]PSK99347.1 uncharacterized protein DUF3558 [Murinocardiopsis flavida]
MRRPRSCALGAVPLMVLAGCTAGPAEPTHVASTKSMRIPEVVFTAAPRTIEGIDLCDLIAPDQARALGLSDQGTPIESEAGDTDVANECLWGSASAADNGRVALRVHRRLTFRTLLMQHNADESEVTWRKGHPVFNATGDSFLDCEVYVGVAPTQAFRIEARVGAGSGSDACDLAAAVADTVLTRLPVA